MVGHRVEGLKMILEADRVAGLDEVVVAVDLDLGRDRPSHGNLALSNTTLETRRR